MIVKHLTILLSLFIAANGKCKFKYLQGDVTKAQGNFIINEHNNLRLLIANGTLPGQPRGTDLKKLVWDKTLAAAAKKIANTCEYGHVEVKDKRWPVGQNIYRRTSTEYQKGADWNTTVHAWFDEYKNYSYGSNITSTTGHYTQMIWATTKSVGCAYAFYETKNTMKYEKYYICNYGPGGNFVGELPYKTGEKGCEKLCP